MVEVAEGKSSTCSRAFHGEACPLVIVGAWQLSAGHSEKSDKQEKDESARAMKLHYDAGLTCFDCADIYTGVEALLGSVRQVLRAPLVSEAGTSMRVHTKCVPDLEAMQSGSVTADYLELGILRSLCRLRAPCLDLVQFHWWDYDVKGLEDSYRCLCSLKEKGIVKAIGLTNTDLPHVKALVDVGLEVASNQVQFSLLDRRPLISGMAAFCQEKDIELLCYGSLAGGFLTDRWLGKEDPGFDKLENRSLVKYRLIIDEFGSWSDFQNLLELMAKIAERRRTTIAGVATGWVLQQKGNTRVIMGARGAAHVAGMAAIGSVRLLPEDLQELDKVIEGRGIRGHCFEAERAGGRHTGIMRRNLNGIGKQAHVDECLQRLSLLRNSADPVSKTMRREVDLLRLLGNDVSKLEPGGESPSKKPKL